MPGEDEAARISEGISESIGRSSSSVGIVVSFWFTGCCAVVRESGNLS